MIDFFEWDRRALPLPQVHLDTGPMEPREVLPYLNKLELHCREPWGPYYPDMYATKPFHQVMRQWHVSATVRRSDNACN